MEFNSNQMAFTGIPWNYQDPQYQMQQQQFAFEASNVMLNMQAALVEQNAVQITYNAQQQASEIIFAAKQEAAKIISDAKIEATEYYRNYETSLQNYEAEINEMKDALKSAGHESQIYLEENLQKAANAKKMLDECNETIEKILNPLTDQQLYNTLNKLNQLGLLQAGSPASLKYNLLKERFS